ncbi:MAG: FAD binding domain-containing protein [Saprospiraceae bacterium]|nr:FAD binding domain-containing protein [Saprospiraceae bacterium]
MDFEVVTPHTQSELLGAIAANQGKNFRIGAGYTDLINQFKLRPERDLTVINIAQIREDTFRNISKNDRCIELGALVTASDLLGNDTVRKEFPVLCEAASSVASMQIRNTATIGGNICNASPSADMSGALVALQARCRILNVKGERREEPLVSFIRGPRQTSLEKHEILERIIIPQNTSAVIKSGFEKIGARKSMEISIVFLAYHFQLSESGIIEKAGIACGAVAPVIPFADRACAYIVGKRLNELKDDEKEAFAQKVMEYAAPISDIRASAWYRNEVLYNISKALFE